MNGKIVVILEQLDKAVSRLEEALAEEEKNDYIRDSSIQRFEFTFELAWKTIKVYLEGKGVRVISPRDAIKNAYQMRIIDDEDIWVSMMETRNFMSHMYNEGMAIQVYESLPAYAPILRKLVKELS